MSRKRDIIMVKSSKNDIDNYYLEGNIIQEDRSKILMEKTNIRQKDKINNINLYGSINSDEKNKSFAVIINTEKGNLAKFFDDINQARIFFEKQNDVS